MIRNIISDSGDAGVKDLHMSYVFELNYPHIVEGSAEEAQELKKMKGVSLFLSYTPFLCREIGWANDSV